VHFQNLNASFDIRYIDSDLAIKPTRAEKSGIQNVSAIRCRDNDNTSVTFETVHFSEQLIEGLLALVIAPANTSSTGSTNGIDLIDENYARSIFFCLLE
jgi:hypothetical protein